MELGGSPNGALEESSEMPNIVCPKCKKQYEVHFDDLGKEVKCTKCGNAFEAKVLRAQIRKTKKIHPMVYILSAVGLVLFILVALLVQSSFEEDGPSQMDQRDYTRDGRPDQDQGGQPPPAGTAGEERALETEAEIFCRTFMRMAANNDVNALQDMFSYSGYHRLNRSEDEPQWNDLPPLDQIMKKKEYTARLTDDTARGGAFLRGADIVRLEETAWDGDKGVVEVTLKHRHNGREQDRTFMVQRMGGQLMIYDYTVGPERGGDLVVVTEDAPRTLDEKYKKRISPEGTIEEVAFTPDTDEATAAELTRLTKDLLGENRSASHDARERLIALGKKSVPALLNRLVGLDMAKDADITEANKCISVLRILTGQSFRFSPGMLHETLLDDQAEDLRRSLRLWFGWWDKNKATWTGRDLEKETEDW
jgi:predicted Zn finger-like uncharacterized protein